MTRLLDPTIQNLRELVLRMGSRAESILEKALRSAFERNAQLAGQVSGDDLEIDRLDVEIDNAVLRALALQAPVAEDLREVVATKMVGSDLERVGDLARNIAQSAARLSLHPELPTPPELLQLARDTQGILRRALDAFSERNAAAARAVLDEDDRIDAGQERVVTRALAEIPAHPDRASEAVDTIFIANHLERIADHATNVAEGVILVAEARNVKHAAKLARGGA